MADAALENAMARREHAIQNLTKLTTDINNMLELHTRARNELEHLENFIRMWHAMAGTPLPAELEQNKPEAPAEGGKRIRARNPDRRAVAKQCVKYIREAGRPLMRKDLMERLAADGIEIRGTDPLMVLSTMLWRSKDIIRRLPEGGYWPAGEKGPLEEAVGELEL
jgi:hypothetical protein